jgi:sugar phosphate isomerase/epimerase
MAAPKIAIQARIWGLERVEKEYPQVFDEAIEAGYDGIECRSALLVEQEDGLRKYLSSRELSIIALHANLKSFDTEDRKQILEDLLERMNRIGSKYLLVSMGRMPEYTKWFELAAKVSEQCAQAQVQFCYHNHAGEFEKGYQFFDELTRSYKVALAADLAWVYRAGKNVEEFVERYAEHIKYVHVKDTKGEQWKELGEGEVNLKPILQHVAALNLPWWTVEQDSTDQEPMKSATISREYLKKQLGF